MAEVLQWNRDFLRLSTYGKNFLTKLVNSPETRGYFLPEELLVTQVHPTLLPPDPRFPGTYVLLDGEGVMRSKRGWGGLGVNMQECSRMSTFLSHR
jgi:hypothetical protein